VTKEAGFFKKHGLDLDLIFICPVATRRTIRENPDMVERMVRAMAEGVHYCKNNKESVVKIMQKYARGPIRTFFEEVYESSMPLLVEDTYPTLQGLKNTLEIQASLDPQGRKCQSGGFRRFALRERAEDERVYRQALREAVIGNTARLQAWLMARTSESFSVQRVFALLDGLFR
jgi:hypothetical protein